MPHKVIVVDDHTLLSNAFTGLINTFAGFEVIKVCAHGLELINYLEQDKNQPNVVLMDVRMPVMNGIETTMRLTTHYPTIKVLALSMEEDDHTIQNMIEAGARGFLSKDVAKGELERALKAVIKFGFYNTATVTRIKKGLPIGHIDPPKLKNREIEFIGHACSEMTYKEIALAMNLSPSTVEGYREQLFAKLKVKNRMGLVLYALRTGIVQL